MSGVTPLKSKSQTDWNKCFLCRTEKKGEDLKSPPTHYSFIKNNDGYYMIATNIPLFQGINQLPIILDPIILDEGGGIEETLRRNNAKYHQNCRLFFNNTMLERTRKTAASSNISSDDGKNKIRRTSIEGHMCFYARKKIQHLNFGKP
jgi:hypothetical protein